MLEGLRRDEHGQIFRIEAASLDLRIDHVSAW